MKKFEGKIAVITGATAGIGLATAQRLALEGAHVFITGRRPEELAKAAKLIDGKVTAMQGDVSKLADLDRLYDAVKKQAGHIDILFTNAGGGEFAPLGQISEEHYDKTFAINVKGTLFTVQKALPLLRRGSSVILNASIVASKGTPSFSVYSATKAAVRSFARSWANDLRAQGIRVNAISPGPISTPGLTGLVPGDQLPALRESFISAIPVGRMGEPDDIAKAVSFLASEDSSFINGAELFVDGGMAQI